MLDQLSVFVANRKGRVARVCRVLADTDINMHSLFVADTEEFGVQPRYRIGLKAYKLGEKTGKLTGIALVKEDDDLMMITDGGMFVRTPVSDIPMYGRFASGVIVMRMKPGETLVGIDIVAREQEPADVEAEDGEAGEAPEELRKEETGEN